VSGGVATMVGAVNVTVVGAPCTTGTAAVGGFTRMGFAHGARRDVEHRAALGRNPARDPDLRVHEHRLVRTPALFATLALHFVPEPAAFALLAGGFVALALGGRRRRQGH
jgi:hypothetical protein